MKEYKVKSENKKHFILTLNDQEIGSLKYEKWHSFKAEITVQGNKTYQVEPKGFWRTTIELKQNENVLLNFKMNWGGNIIINTRFDQIEKDLIFKKNGILKNSYVLLNKEEEELLIVLPDFKWSKFNYDYTISATDRFENLSYNIILILTTIHCVNYYMTMASTTGS